MKNIETWRTLLFVADAVTRRTEFITAFTQPLLKPSLRVPRRPNLARNADCRGCGGVEFDDAPFVVFVLFCFCFPKWICFYYLKKKQRRSFFRESRASQTTAPALFSHYSTRACTPAPSSVTHTYHVRHVRYGRGGPWCPGEFPLTRFSGIAPRHLQWISRARWRFASPPTLRL